MAKARNIESIPERRGSRYPEPFSSRMGERSKRRLGEEFGLSQFGVNLTTVGPGAQSALRHWHTLEDELIYVIEGEVVLVSDDGEQVMRAGDVIGFKAGLQDAHHMINRSNAPARYIEVGSRIDADTAHYPDDDLKWADEGDFVALHKDGTRY
jgi:uncharacterized cupin superfamily protein